MRIITIHLIKEIQITREEKEKHSSLRSPSYCSSTNTEKMENLEYQLYTPFDKPTSRDNNIFVDFIHAQTLANKSNIKKAIDYAMKEIPSFGGHILAVQSRGKLIGLSIVNKTGMGGYMPDFILAYMATKDTPTIDHHSLQKRLLEKTLSFCNGNISYHVKPSNPMIDTCKEYGFGNKRMEMTYSFTSGERAKADHLPQVH